MRFLFLVALAALFPENIRKFFSNLLEKESAAAPGTAFSSESGGWRGILQAEQWRMVHVRDGCPFVEDAVDINNE